MQIQSLSLPYQMIAECRSIFIECNEFGKYELLAALFQVDELKPFRARIPREDMIENQVDRFLAFIVPLQSSNGSFVFLTFLGILEQKYADDYLGKKIADFRKKINQRINLSNPTEADTTSTFSSQQLATLHQKLLKYFSADEISGLCMSLGLNYGYQELEGGGIEAKTRNLVQYLNRRDSIALLLTICEKERPNISWKI